MRRCVMRAQTHVYAFGVVSKRGSTFGPSNGGEAMVADGKSADKEATEKTARNLPLSGPGKATVQSFSLRINTVFHSP